MTKFTGKFNIEIDQATLDQIAEQIEKELKPEDLQQLKENLKNIK
jgi:hypothetical protein